MAKPSAYISEDDLFKSESEMQMWLSSELNKAEGLASLIIPFSDEEYSYVDKKISDSYNYCLKTLSNTKIVCENQDISQFSDEILRPDFLLYSVDYEAWIIIEIKNIPNPTRQAGTELGAYTNALKTYFPNMSDGDVINVVISNDWPTLIKNYIFNEIFWLNRSILCLRPVKHESGIKLECIRPAILTKAYSDRKLSPKDFSGYQFCIYGKDIYSGGEVSDIEKNIEQIKSSFQRMVNKASRLHSHGFAFLWRDFRKYSLAAYSITIVDINPFKNNLYYTCNEKGIAAELQHIIWEYESTGNTYSLWEIINDADFYLREISSTWPEAPSNWITLREFIVEDAEIMEFKCWGRISELYENELANEYNKGRFDLKFTDPGFGFYFINNKLFT
ncbi:hypothetical protein K7H21_09765 [Klebsiella sp. CTHL.F3a]|uniref:hypothetical protein n=1 Tax=Klebsiella TaxID=570 RepID=UPI0011AB65FB|nr:MULTISPECIES: hypothetical protein [Klebsiella]QZY81889.1 hypothetical protein K7H21_09765 [Klebsiella sp. CTHL.F3a]